MKQNESEKKKLENFSLSSQKSENPVAEFLRRSFLQFNKNKKKMLRSFPTV